MISKSHFSLNKLGWLLAAGMLVACEHEQKPQPRQPACEGESCAPGKPSVTQSANDKTCSEQGATRWCGSVPSEDKSSCWQGIQVCSEGKWSACRPAHVSSSSGAVANRSFDKAPHKKTGSPARQSLAPKRAGFGDACTAGDQEACLITLHPANGVPFCVMGVRDCDGGTFGVCEETDDPSPDPGGLGTAVDCDENPCDPYCQAFDDEAGTSMSGGGIVFDGDGLTIVGEPTPVNPNGPIDSDLEELIDDAGLLPSGDYIYHELLPGGAAAGPDPLVLNGQLSFIDVYFLLDTSATMGEALVALSSEVAGATGIISQIRDTFPNARFGVGHFHGYETMPHAVGNRTAPSRVEQLWHSLNMTQTDTHAAAIINWLGSSATTGNYNSTEGFAVALFAASYIDPSLSSLGGYLFRGAGADPSSMTDPLNYWVKPRNGTGSLAWASDYTGMSAPSGSGPCPDPAVVGGSGQGLAYPCFAPGATPIFLLMTDNPGENGPGGHYSYGHPSPTAVPSGTMPIPGNSVWPTATGVSGNGAASGAIAIDVTTFGRFTGTFGASGPSNGRQSAGRKSTDGTVYTDVSFSALNQNFPTLPQGNCVADDGQSQPEAFFSFSLTEPKFVHFNTWGSGRDTVLYVIDTATTNRVACNDTVTFVPSVRLKQANPAFTGVGGPAENADLQAYLGPGNYQLVVDAKAFSECPSGWFKHPSNGKCYGRSNTARTWDAARTFCRDSMLGELATIDSDALRDWISANVTSVNSAAHNIGLRRNGASFAWDSGTAFSYANWGSGQPTASPNNCAVRGTDGKWRTTTRTSGTRATLCERPVATKTDQYFLQVNAMDDGWPIATPSFEQTVDSLNDLGAKVIGIDVSGMGPIKADASGNRYFATCDCGALGDECTASNQVIDRWTYPHLQEVARRTGSYDATNADTLTNPFVFSMDKKGGPCQTTDPSIGSQVVSAVLGLTSKSREDVVIRALDHDDAHDFDYGGTVGAVPQLTPYQVDEGPAPSLGRPYGLLINSVSVVPVTNGFNGSHDPGPLGLPRCIDDPATTDVLEQCLPDTVVQFEVTFSAPVQLELLDHEQVFTFQAAAMAGASVVATEDVVIVLPEIATEARTFERIYDLTDVCAPDRTPTWGLFSWLADTPGNSKIRLYARTAEEEADLDSAPRVKSPGGFAVVARDAASGGYLMGPPSYSGDTQNGSQDIQSVLNVSGEPANFNFLKLEMEFVPGGDGTDVPTLLEWQLSVSCPPGD